MSLPSSAAVQPSAPPSPPLHRSPAATAGRGFLLQPPKVGYGQHRDTLLREQGETSCSAGRGCGTAHRHGSLKRLEEKTKDKKPGLLTPRRACGVEKNQKVAPEKE